MHSLLGPLAGFALASLANATTLTEQARLTPADHPGSFGGAVALDGGTAVLGAPGYIFEGSGASWTEQASLSAAGVEDFGASVALSGDTLAVGAPLAQKVYVYVRNGGVWSLQAELVPSDLGGPMDHFGISVAVEGDTLVVGAFTHLAVGSVYVFTRSVTVWSERTQLVAEIPQYLSLFGDAVAISGNTASSRAATW